MALLHCCAPAIVILTEPNAYLFLYLLRCQLSTVGNHSVCCAVCLLHCLGWCVEIGCDVEAREDDSQILGVLLQGTGCWRTQSHLAGARFGMRRAEEYVGIARYIEGVYVDWDESCEQRYLES